MKARTVILASVALFAIMVVAGAQDRATGSIKGKVKVETELRRCGRGRSKRRSGGNCVATDKMGLCRSEFTSRNDGLTFRKAGLSVGTIENVEVKSGKTRSLGDRLVLTIDEGSIAFIRGSVFSPSGRSVPGARVELARILEDGTTKKIDGRITTETGSFVFRLTPQVAKYAFL